jgi:hypothetical protein
VATQLRNNTGSQKDPGENRHGMDLILADVKAAL